MRKLRTMAEAKDENGSEALSIGIKSPEYAKSFLSVLTHGE